MIHIGILVPICSRDMTYTNKEEIPFFKYMLPALRKTMEPTYKYTFFVGCDDDDEFYLSNRRWFEEEGYHFFVLTGCQHAPAFAWNQLYKHALEFPEQIDYFFQLGDDVVMHTGWTTPFVTYLRAQNDVGVVGPCDRDELEWRVRLGYPLIIEHSFVSRKHYDIFETFFRANIKNWYCDNWMTGVYAIHGRASLNQRVTCKNVLKTRYEQETCPDINQWIQEDAKHILKHI